MGSSITPTYRNNHYSSRNDDKNECGSRSAERDFAGYRVSYQVGGESLQMISVQLKWDRVLLPHIEIIITAVGTTIKMNA